MQTPIPMSQRTSIANQINQIGFGSSSGKCGDPGLQVSKEKKRLANLSIPAIPNRFLTPVLKFDVHEGPPE